MGGVSCRHSRGMHFRFLRQGRFCLCLGRGTRLNLQLFRSGFGLWQNFSLVSAPLKKKIKCSKE